MPEIDDEEIGHRIGKILASLVELVAEIDGITYDEVIEKIFTDWWVEQIDPNSSESPD